MNLRLFFVQATLDAVDIILQVIFFRNAKIKGSPKTEEKEDGNGGIQEAFLHGAMFVQQLRFYNALCFLEMAVADLSWPAYQYDGEDSGRNFL